MSLSWWTILWNISSLLRRPSLKQAPILSLNSTITPSLLSKSSERETCLNIQIALENSMFLTNLPTKLKMRATAMLRRAKHPMSPTAPLSTSREFQTLWTTQVYQSLPRSWGKSPRITYLPGTRRVFYITKETLLLLSKIMKIYQINNIW